MSTLRDQFVTPDPAALSRRLRGGDSDDLARRRAVVALSLGSAAVMGVISLYQTGVISRLPEPRVPGRPGLLDANRVNGSAEGYAG